MKDTAPHPSGAMVARNIVAAIGERGMTRRSLAKKAGIPSSTFYLKLGKPHTFTIPELVYISEALGMGMDIHRFFKAVAA